VRAVRSGARRGVLCVFLACSWHGAQGNHTDVDMPEQHMPVGRLAEIARPWPGITFYPCQSLGGLATQYCLRPRHKDNRSSEAPHLSKRWVYHPEPSRALQSTGKRVDARRVSLGYLRSCDAVPTLRPRPPPVVWKPGAPRRWMKSPPARLAVRLERFQACALRHHSTLHVSPKSNKQATGQGHDTNAPHALASQSKARIEPDAEGGVGLIA
jgi:hypothetical protein